MPTVILKPHPASPASPIDRIEVELERRGEIGLRLTYRASGDLERLRMPKATEPGRRADELWRHTCFEAFIRPASSEGYLELNFAASIQWAAYRFEGYRAGMAEANVEPWELVVCREADLLKLEVDIEPGRMARPDLPAPAWLVGLSAVIEDVDGGLSYWALAHPSAKPDFHHPDSFVLELP